MTGRPLLAASVSGAPAWILWQVSRDALRVRINQFERDPFVNPQVVRDLRATAAGLEEAARQYMELVESSRSVVAEATEVSGGGSVAGLERPSGMDISEVAARLGCSKRWASGLCVLGRLAATKKGRSWVVDGDSVADYLVRGAASAA